MIEYLFDIVVGFATPIHTARIHISLFPCHNHLAHSNNGMYFHNWLHIYPPDKLQK